MSAVTRQDGVPTCLLHACA